jgi:Ser/Thr protein kinase RdoA (MazF antagonist)
MGLKANESAENLEATARFLARRLGGDARQWELQRPEMGTSGRVVLATRGAGTGDALRCVVHLMGGKVQLDRFRWQLRTMEQAGLPGPRLLAASRRWDRWLRGEPLMAVESFLEGELIHSIEREGTVTAAMVEGIGRMLGRMHAVTSERFGWGRDRAGADRHAGFCLGRIRRRRLALRKAFEAEGDALCATGMPSRFERAVEDLERRMAHWRPHGPFVLVHRELSSRDMLWREGKGEVVFVDVGGSRFDHRLLDVLPVRRWLGRLPNGSAAGGAAEVFEQAYWRTAGEGFRAPAVHDERVIGGLLDVNRMATRVSRWRSDASRRGEMEKEMAQLVERLESEMGT